MQLSQFIKDHNLAISIVNVSSLEEFNRIDAEYYKPEYLAGYRNGISTKPIGQILTDCQYGLSKDMNEDGVGYEIYRMNDLKDGLCSDEDLKRADISEAVMEKYRLKRDDILFNRVNSLEFVGRTGIYKYSKETNRVFASYLVRLNTDETQVLPDYLNIFLNCKYGVKQIKRKARPAVNQANVNAEELKRIELPIAGNKLQQSITNICNTAFDLLVKSKDLIREENNRLVSHIGLNSFVSTKLNYSTRTLLTVKKEKRLDGEYWQPIFDQVEEVIKKYPNGYDTLDNLISVSSETLKAEKDLFYKYVELANVNSGIGLIEEPSLLLGSELPSRARMKLRKNDVVVSSVEGSADKVALILEDSGNLVGSTGFFVLREDYFYPEVILTLLRVPLINALYKRQAQGTILTAVPRGSLSRVLLPKLPKDYQEAVVAKVKEAHGLFTQSKHLLEVAKRGVEIFIEESEEHALTYIQNEVN